MRYSTFLHIFVAFFNVISTFILVHGSVPYQANWSDDGFCQKRLFPQPISSDGCETTFTENAFCYGQCSSTFSYFTNSEVNFSCSACQPEYKSKILVKLKCNKDKIKIKEISKTESCRCIKRICRVLSQMNYLNENVTPPNFVKNLKRKQKPQIKRSKRLTVRKNKCLSKVGRQKFKCLMRWKKRLARSQLDT